MNDYYFIFTFLGLIGIAGIIWVSTTKDLKDPDKEVK